MGGSVCFSTRILSDIPGGTIWSSGMVTWAESVQETQARPPLTHKYSTGGCDSTEDGLLLFCEADQEGCQFLTFINIFNTKKKVRRGKARRKSGVFFKHLSRRMKNLPLGIPEPVTKSTPPSPREEIDFISHFTLHFSCLPRSQAPAQGHKGRSFICCPAPRAFVCGEAQGSGPVWEPRGLRLLTEACPGAAAPLNHA